jgi:hypothetical protein
MESIAEIKNDVEELEPQVERLKALYNQYFMGIERLPPLVLRKKVDRTIWKLRRIRFPNTALRFKFQQIIQRYNTYQQHWSRIMREIERGTFKGHVVRAAKRFGADAVMDGGRRARLALAGTELELPDDEKQERVWELPDGIDDLDFDDDAPTPPSNRFEVPPELAAATYEAAPVRGMPAEQLHAMIASAEQEPEAAVAERPSQKRGALFGAAPAAGRPPAPKLGKPPPPKLGKPPPPKLGKPPAPKPADKPPPPHPIEKTQPDRPKPEPRTKEIYDAYIEARKASGETTRGLTYDKVEKSLRSQTERLRKKHAGRSVDYEVVTMDGKAMIRPVIK